VLGSMGQEFDRCRYQCALISAVMSLVNKVPLGMVLRVVLGSSIRRDGKVKYDVLGCAFRPTRSFTPHLFLGKNHNYMLPYLPIA